MMLISDIEIELTRDGVGCFAHVFIRRLHETVILPVKTWFQYSDLDEWDRTAAANEQITLFFRMCEREYQAHDIVPEDHEYTRRYLDSKKHHQPPDDEDGKYPLPEDPTPHIRFDDKSSLIQPPSDEE